MSKRHQGHQVDLGASGQIFHQYHRWKFREWAVVPLQSAPGSGNYLDPEDDLGEDSSMPETLKLSQTGESGNRTRKGGTMHRVATQDSKKPLRQEQLPFDSTPVLSLLQIGARTLEGSDCSDEEFEIVNKGIKGNMRFMNNTLDQSRSTRISKI